MAREDRNNQCGVLLGAPSDQLGMDSLWWEIGRGALGGTHCWAQCIFLATRESARA